MFTRPRQLHFAASALIWLPDGFTTAADYAQQAVDAYSNPTDPVWSFAGAAGSRAVLAIARIRNAEVEGAADALAPVLDLPVELRINGIVQSVNHVHRALNDVPASATSRGLQERIESYSLTPARALAR